MDLGRRDAHFAIVSIDRQVLEVDTAEGGKQVASRQRTRTFIVQAPLQGTPEFEGRRSTRTRVGREQGDNRRPMVHGERGAIRIGIIQDDGGVVPGPEQVDVLPLDPDIRHLDFRAPPSSTKIPCPLFPES